MLRRRQNDLLTRTGLGTPGGALFRRYWQPVALSEELPADGAPLPVRILGEDLVLFRDDAGRPGLLGLQCSHRGADLSYGRVEDGGLRCLYHGWLYDVHGNCLDQPAEAPGRDYRRKIHHRAYPCREAGKLIFTYLGPGEPPLLPAYEFFTVPDSHRHVTKVHQECNYLQANEGNIDPPHIAFLHRHEDAAAYRVEGPGVLSDGAVRRALLQQDAAPSFDMEPTAFGFRIVQTRAIGSDDSYFLTVTNFIMPNASAFGSDGDAYRVAWHVPIDDEHHWRYMLLFSRAAPLDHDRLADPELTADYRLIRNKTNRYLQDREEMRTKTFSGMGTSFKALDVHVTEGQGPIMDRTQEHLGPGDRAIIAARRMLIAAIADVQAGRDPPFVVRSPEANPVADLDAVGVVLPTSTAWRQFWDRHWDTLGRAVRTASSLAVCLLLALGLACAPAAPAPSPTAAAPAPVQAPAPSAAAAQPAPLKSIKVGIATASLSYLLQRIADVKGFYREAGFDAELVIIIQQGPAALASLAAGELQFAHFAGSGARAAATGLPVRVVQCPGVKPFYRVVLAPGVKSLREVEGRAFSVATLGTTPHLIGRDILKRHGVDTDKVDFLAGGDAAVRYAGLQSGQVAGGVVSIPEAIKAAQDGLTVASGADDMPAFCDGGLVVSVDTIANNRADVTRYITVMNKAVEFLKANPDESARILGEWAELDPEVAAETIRLGQVNSSFSTDKQLAQEAIESVLKQAVETGGLKEEVPLSAVADLSMYP